ncbi:hypothetical protein FRB93_002421 [Tulasnella sp. JGI-2019a]|nr:hypothetical protein FRB93_002421 [Tulasnella sp. JGI-2019a]
MTSKQLIWLITGTSTGIGKELCFAALQRSDKVIATARNVDKIDPTLREKGAKVFQLDIIDSLENLKKIANEAITIYGRIDVLVNNTGYIALGSIEEETPESTFQQYNVGVFGPLNVVRAFLPSMRERKSGTLIFFGSQGGWTGLPGCRLYCGTKSAIRGQVNNALPFVPRLLTLYTASLCRNSESRTRAVRDQGLLHRTRCIQDGSSIPRASTGF